MASTIQRRQARSCAERHTISQLSQVVSTRGDFDPLIGEVPLFEPERFDSYRAHQPSLMNAGEGYPAVAL